MVIKQAQLQDLDNFYSCFELVMREGYSGYSQKLINLFLYKDYSKGNFYIWMEKYLRVIFLAIEEGEVIGFIVGDNTYGGIGFISWIGVLPGSRNKGIGAELFRTYESFAASRNAHVLELYTYKKVLPFYLKLGFKEIGHREEGYYGQPNIIMNKTIGKWSDVNIPDIN